MQNVMKVTCTEVNTDKDLGRQLRVCANQRSVRVTMLIVGWGYQVALACRH
jgi:hypothetical protein